MFHCFFFRKLGKVLKKNCLQLLLLRNHLNSILSLSTQVQGQYWEDISTGRISVLTECSKVCAKKDRGPILSNYMTEKCEKNLTGNYLVTYFENIRLGNVNSDRLSLVIGPLNFLSQVIKMG